MGVNIPTEILMAARDIIKDEKNWCKLHSAVDQMGNDVSSISNDAVRFCVIGSLNRAAYKILGDDYYDTDDFDQSEEALEEALYDSGCLSTIANFNDRGATQHSDVINVYNKAISNELNKGQHNEKTRH